MSRQNTVTTIVLKEQSDSASHIDFFSNLVFDELFDNDLLGLMLSSHHLNKFLFRMKNMDGKTASLLACIGGEQALFDELHNAMLSKFDGFYIKECSMKADELYKYLDARINGYDFSRNRMTQLEASSTEAHVETNNNVLCSWNYRKACAPTVQYKHLML